MPAEKEPVRFHGTGPFDIQSGSPLKAAQEESYTDVFSRKIVSLAQKNKNIIAITAAMPEGAGLDKFRDRFPERFFDAGIAEAHALCFAAGLAKKARFRLWPYIPHFFSGDMTSLLKILPSSRSLW